MLKFTIEVYCWDVYLSLQLSVLFLVYCYINKKLITKNKCVYYIIYQQTPLTSWTANTISPHQADDTVSYAAA